MGTNFYLYNRADPCPTCGRSDPPSDRLHIGKSSAGWCFSLRVYPDVADLPNNLEEWKKLWGKPGFVIVDEYSMVISQDEMLAKITKRESGSTGRSREFYERNGGEEGPNGLIRHKLGVSCVAHGDGTYDLVEREFC
jgi:hypothetical protein